MTLTRSTDCFANYQPSDICDACHAVYQCIDATIESDGYYDQLAEREEALWELIEEGPVLSADGGRTTQ